MKFDDLPFETPQLPRSSRRERLYFRIFGRQPQSVVDRRLDALDHDRALMEVWKATQGTGRWA